MHRYIAHDNASTHHIAQVFSENARMHDETRKIIETLMAKTGVNSVRQLALDCGMSQSTLHRFMKGETDSLDFIHLQSIAQFFSLTVSQLIGETPFDDDRKVRVVSLAMQHMPEYKKDVVVATSLTLAEQRNQPEQPRLANGE